MKTSLNFLIEKNSNNEWYPRNTNERPRVCPECKSPNWDKPYKFRRTKSGKVKRKAQ